MDALQIWNNIDFRIGVIEKVEDFIFDEVKYFICSLLIAKDSKYKLAFIVNDGSYQKSDLLKKKIFVFVNFHLQRIGPFETDVRVPQVKDKEGKMRLVVSQS